MKKTNKGITLIALIITIVVMLILVGVVVNTTINSNLINKVKEAKGDWQEAEGKDSNISKITVGGVEYDNIKGYMQTLCEHEYGDWTVVKEPTLAEDGERYRTCIKCEVKQTETTKVEECEEGSHTYGEWETDTEATCVAKGSKHQTCTTCGKTVTQEIEVDEDKHALDENGACTREGCDYVEGTGNKTPISKEDSFIGYYADIDDDGNIDGIIYADLAFDGSGQWTDWYGDYSYSKKDENTLNDYYICQEEEYQYKSFKSKPVIAPITVDKNEANDRFYVMALEDFTTQAYTDETDSSKNYPAYTSYYFYKNAVDENSNGLMDPLVTTDGFSSTECVGRKNTKAMIDIWGKNGYTGATQDNQDIWKHIGTEVANCWFIPSRAEWAAFGKFATDQGEAPISDWGNYGFYSWYLTSSQIAEDCHWCAVFDGEGGFGIDFVYNVGNSVRLSATF